MRLLFVSSARHFGGTERWATMAIAELERRGHAVWMACPDVPHATNFTRRENLLGWVPSSLWDRAAWARMEQVCRDQGIEAIIPVSQMMYFPAGQLARKLNIAMVLRLGIVRLPWRPVIDWYGYGIYPDAIIVNTQRIKQILAIAPFVRKERIHVIYNGIVERHATPIPRRDDRFTITSTGTLSWRKGMKHLIEAVSVLPVELRRKVHVKLIGDGPARNSIERQVARLGLTGQVELTGHVGNPADHVSASDLFVLLSVQEGISNAVLEAMAAGVPALVTLVGGHGEFIRHGETGYAAASRNPKRVAQQLAMILTDASRAKIGAAGRAVVRKMFSMEAMGDRLEQVLQQAIKSKKA